MRYLSNEAKKIIVEKVLNNKESRGVVVEVAKQNNISTKTVRNYMKLFRGGQLESHSPRIVSGAELTDVERFEHVVATAKFDESERGAYCRERGLYSFQLQEWKEAFMASNKNDRKGVHEPEIKALRAENKALKSDLNRKDRALAEASALLILKKKAALIWGDAEDDCSAVNNGHKP